jgi:DNA-binding transcriptional LysR family regulator
MSIADWEQQRAFLAVLREGSLSGAARALGVAQPTVRRRIETLESGLGAALFTRSPSGLQPTEQALALAGHAEAMALAADAFVRSASAAAHEVAGTVRITASEVIAIEVLPALIAPLLARHPGLSIALAPNNRTEDMLRREADIAVRMVPPTQGALVARRIGVIPIGLHAHRDYLARRGTPETIEHVLSHTLIGVEHDSSILRALQARGFPLEMRDFAFRSDADLAHLAAIRAGIGIGLCQLPLAARDPALVPLFTSDLSFPLETWVVMHEDLRGVARVRAVFDALVEGLLGYLA